MIKLTPNDALDAACRQIGTQADLARRLGVTPQAVAQWRSDDRIPVERCIQIEELTAGKVLCEQLRPDVNWAVLRSPSRAVA